MWIRNENAIETKSEELVIILTTKIKSVKKMMMYLIKNKLSYIKREFFIFFEENFSFSNKKINFELVFTYLLNKRRGSWPRR